MKELSAEIQLIHQNYTIAGSYASKPLGRYTLLVQEVGEHFIVRVIILDSEGGENEAIVKAERTCRAISEIPDLEEKMLYDVFAQADKDRVELEQVLEGLTDESDQ